MKIPAMRRLLLLLAVSALWMAAPATAQHEPTQPAAGHEAGSQAAAPATSEQQLAEASHEAAEGGDNLKESPAVKWLARTLHIPEAAGYWVFYGLDFLIIALGAWWLMKSKVPAYFRTRNESIRRSMEEARHTTEEARARLAQIEARLARLGDEITDMRRAAEAEAMQEEERIRAGAEEDKRRIIAAAEQEIAAAAKLARRDLKAYAASLAVELAERRIKVDAGTDRELVRQFADQLGKDGQ